MAVDDEVDYISDLPPVIVESILTRLPIRDAVRTSTLSSKWRYRWATMPHLVFDDRCIGDCHDKALIAPSLVNFVTRALFLHQGPIHKFHLSTVHLQCSADVDQWLLFLSRTELRELILQLGEEEWFRVPSCLFNSPRLARLELHRCEFDPPINFKGFPFLRSLNLHQVLIATEALESLISCCPVLETLSLSYFDNLSLRITAPNLKYLYMEGEFKDICLENTPLLAALSVAMYMTDEIGEHLEQSSNCNFVKFLGALPRLEQLIGQIYFTKYLSLGYCTTIVPITYDHLKVVELHQVSFEDTHEIRVVLQLIVNSPILRELYISASSNTLEAIIPRDLEFWDEECPTNCRLNQLQVVKITDLSGVPHEMEFVKFLLASSPAMEKMTITTSAYVLGGKLTMLVELVKFRRASPQAEVLFIND